MPLKLIDPDPSRTPNYRIRGTYLRVSVNCTTGTPDKGISKRALAKIKSDIESGRFAKSGGMTFAMAATSYLDAGGEPRFISPLNEHFGDTLVEHIDQAALDAAAVAIYPRGAPATRNRQVYTPTLAILAHAGIEKRFKRPKGAQGNMRAIFLEPDEAWRLLAAAEATDKELCAFLTLVLYTGIRLSEALGLRCSAVSLAESRAFIPETKNGDPRALHLPEAAVAALANHPRGLDRPKERVFRWHKGSKFYDTLHEVYARAKVDPRGAPDHILRHTYGTWMRRYAGADSRDLKDTGAWRATASADRYTHTDVSDASRMADKLPTRAQSVRNGAK
jgi:integrase